MYKIDHALYSSSSYYQGLTHFIDIEAKKDSGRVHYYLTKAFHDGFSDANVLLNYMSKKKTDKTVVLKQVFEWYIDNHDLDRLKMVYSLGFVYHHGRGIGVDCKLAFQYYEIAVNQGDANAKIQLADMYKGGLGVKKNFGEAIDLYSKIPDKDDCSCYALRGLGLLYDLGDGAEKEDEKAFEYYKMSEYEGNKDAYYNIALLYYYGKGVANNFDAAFEFFE
ncbi:HCP-like protein [Backusella circina FSU 941]|nr:HCP-like protein [Backusella circina FSU 941]